jgi:hypothetical protein
MPGNGRNTKENELGKALSQMQASKVVNPSLKLSQQPIKIPQVGAKSSPAPTPPSQGEPGTRQTLLESLTTPLFKQNSDLLQLLESQLSTNRVKEALETAHVFFAKSRMLYEVYESEAEVYYCGLLYLAISHLVNCDYQVAEKHFRTVIKAQSSTERLSLSEKMNVFRRLSLVGAFICTAELQKKPQAKKLFDVLEEETLEDLPETMLVRFKICESQIFEAETDVAKSIDKLAHLASKHLILDNPKINVLQKISFTLRISELLAKLRQFDDATEWVEKYLGVFRKDATDVSEEALFGHVDILCAHVGLIAEQETLGDEEKAEEVCGAYRQAMDVLFGELQDKLSDSNFKAFFSPIRKYIVYLSKVGMLEEALKVTHRLIIAEDEFFGHFHPHVGKSFELKGKLMAKVGDVSGAMESLAVAFNIFTDLSDKEAAAAIKRRIAEISTKKA